MEERRREDINLSYKNPTQDLHISEKFTSYWPGHHGQIVKPNKHIGSIYSTTICNCVKVGEETLDTINSFCHVLLIEIEK